MNEPDSPTPETAPEGTPTGGGETAEVEPVRSDGPVQAAPPKELPVFRSTGRYTFRFGFIYAVLVLVAVGAAVGLAVIVIKPNVAKTTSWSTWKPSSGSTAVMARQIADHVSHEYHLNKAGAPLVAVVAGPPQYTAGTHKVAISNIALRKTSTNDKGIQIIPSGKTWTDQFCGLGAGCSIASGVATPIRGRLVRREALEVALYTFKFVPAIESIVAFMPPPPGQTGSTLLYLQKSQLKDQLSQPLRKTLTLAKPPLPTDADTQEAATIDKLTRNAIYSYSLQALQDNSALLVLDPIAT